MRLITYFLFQFFVIGLVAQPTVDYHLPFTEAADFEAVDVAENDKGFAAGSCGVLMTTTDAGENWEIANSPASDDLLSVACRPGTGCQQVFVATSSTLYRSMDGGESWSSTEIPGNGTVKGIVFTGDDETVIVSRNITQLAISRDNGETISQIPMGKAPATLLQFVSPNTGFFFSNTTDLVRTDDGGDTWTTLYDHSEGVRGVNFLNENEGFMYSASGVLFKTTDGGHNWTEISTYADISFIFLSMEVKSLMEIELVSSRGVYRSTDGGFNFTVMFGLGPNGATFNDTGITQVCRRGNQYWMAATNTAILYSGDDLNEVSHQLGGDRAAFLSIDAVDGNIYAITFQYGISRSIDGGESFEAITYPSIVTGRNVLVLQDGRVIMSGNGAPKISEDNGESFEPLLSNAGVPNTGYRIARQLANGRIVIGGDDVAIYSDDNTESWSYVYHGLDDFTFNMSTFGEVLGINTKDSLTVSLDGGTTWPIVEAMPADLGQQPKFYAITEDVWLAASSPSGYLKYTDNGGQDWTDLDERAVAIVMDNNGRLYGLTSTGLNYSDDQGATWQEVEVEWCSPFSLTLADIAYEDATDRIFVTGRGGRVFSVDVSGGVSNTPRLNIVQEPLVVFPNPTTGQVNIKLPATLTNVGSSIDVQLFSTTGQLVTQKREAATHQLQLDLNEQPNGIYWVKVSGENWSRTTRLVLNR